MSSESNLNVLTSYIQVSQILMFLPVMSSESNWCKSNSLVHQSCPSTYNVHA